ncbi:hypothetical protein ATANTOWER_010963 [Ataeniobius toweri]|uniref:Uncharacterized protein n=1 Tax=Ataeniobius toweri TaxID=208326 RepID=A0ABU7BYW2_9TELE|nr:hypothetical protein [Ataeniobius toweri]
MSREKHIAILSTSLILKLANFEPFLLSNNFHTKECCCVLSLVAFGMVHLWIRKIFWMFEIPSGRSPRTDDQAKNCPISSWFLGASLDLSTEMNKRFLSDMLLVRIQLKTGYFLSSLCLKDEVSVLLCRLKVQV